MASQLFGTAVKPASIIGETLKRATKATDLTNATFIAALKARLEDGKKSPQSEKAFIEDPLAIWIESTFGVRPAEEDAKRLVRTRPRRIGGKDGAATQLQTLTGVPIEKCVEAIQEALLSGYRVSYTATGFPVFAFRLHQFISKGDTVYSSVEPEDERHITFQAQKYVPGFDRNKRLVPLAFCRECGQEYYVVQKTYEASRGVVSFEARELLEKAETALASFCQLDKRLAPGTRRTAQAAPPEDWLEEKDGKSFVKDSRREDVPVNCNVNAGAVEDNQHGIKDAHSGPVSVLPLLWRFLQFASALRLRQVDRPWFRGPQHRDHDSEPLRHSPLEA